jgi:hypothetical protein
VIVLSRPTGRGSFCGGRPEAPRGASLSVGGQIDGGWWVGVTRRRAPARSGFLEYGDTTVESLGRETAGFYFMWTDTGLLLRFPFYYSGRVFFYSS